MTVGGLGEGVGVEVGFGVGVLVGVGVGVLVGVGVGVGGGVEVEPQVWLYLSISDDNWAWLAIEKLGKYTSA